MVQCLLKAKILFMNMIGYDYIHIVINDGINVSRLEHGEAMELIEDYGLKQVDPKLYNSSMGKIYDDGEFKQYMDAHPETKERIYRILTNYKI